MAFKKTWTDEQEKTLLEKYKNSNIDDLAKELKKTPKAIRQKFSALKKRKQKAPKKPIENKEKTPKETDITVSQVPLKEEAEELRQTYLDNTSNFSQELPKEPTEASISLGQEENVENTPIASEEETLPPLDMDWSVFSDSITGILDERFKANDLAEMSDKEKEMFSNALNEVMKRRAVLIGKYSDIIALATATFSVFTPRIMEFTSRKKKKKKEKETTATADLTKEEFSVSQKPNEEVMDEKQEAMKRYEAMTGETMQ